MCRGSESGVLVVCVLEEAVVLEMKEVRMKKKKYRGRVLRNWGLCCVCAVSPLVVHSGRRGD